MELSRRKFFRAGAGVVAGLSLGATACGPEGRERIPGDLSDLDRNAFTAEVGSQFQLVSGVAPFTNLALIAVEDLGAQQQAPRPGEVFSARFLGPKDVALPQDLYRLEHPRMGGLSLLIVPLGVREDGRLYEAVFNRQVG